MPIETISRGNRRRHAWAMRLLAAIASFAMLAFVLTSWREALPGTSAPAELHRFALEPGATAWQTIYVPACAPGQIVVPLIEPLRAPGAAMIAWFAVDDPARWPAAAAAETTIVLGPSVTQLELPVPSAPHLHGRLIGLRITADRTTLPLLATRDNSVRTGYLTRRAGYLSGEDLVFRSVWQHGTRVQSDTELRDGPASLSATPLFASTWPGGHRWLAGPACVAASQPPLLDRPVLLFAALVAMCIAVTWLAGTAGAAVRENAAAGGPRRRDVI